MIPVAHSERGRDLGIPSMDTTHREFVDLVNRLNACDGAEFILLFPQLVEHTRAHFASEEILMEQSRFPAAAEHKAEHARVLGDLQRFGARLHRGSNRLVQAYVRDQIPGWFELHLMTMDSALAAHLRGKG